MWHITLLLVLLSCAKPHSLIPTVQISTRTNYYQYTFLPAQIFIGTNLVYIQIIDWIKIPCVYIDYIDY